MKILYYNWVPFDDDEHRGGGVTVYQKNLIASLIKQTKSEIYFISSGVAYSPHKAEPYVRKTANVFKSKCKTFQIINSPIFSPGHCSFDDTEIFLNDLKLYTIFKNFIQKYGPFDVIHFNNFEGLSLNVLKIKQDFPNTKIILSLHNYYLFCPQVNLWKREHENCQDFHNGVDCLSCLKFKPDKAEVLFANQLAYILKKYHFYSNSLVFRACFRYAYKIKRISKLYNTFRGKQVKERKCIKINANNYRKYREKNISYINKYVDKVLCVSDRVREIAVKMGVSQSIAVTDYIGTLMADKQIGTSSASINLPVFSIIFMGYMRRDKGFFFLLNALKHINPDIAQNIKIIFAAQISDDRTLKKIYKLGKIYNEIEVRDGYSHKELPQILKNVHLGIIPVLWEDNLPQVAIEMVAHGVPILTSDLGGAHELCNNPKFVFENNNVSDFAQKLEFLYHNRFELQQYWKNSKKLTTFKEHIEKLMMYYQ